MFAVLSGIPLYWLPINLAIYHIRNSGSDIEYKNIADTLFTIFLGNGRLSRMKEWSEVTAFALPLSVCGILVLHWIDLIIIKSHLCVLRRIGIIRYFLKDLRDYLLGVFLFIQGLQNYL